MNMLTRQQLDAPRPSCPPVEGMVLDFGEKRAGRAVADLQNVNASVTPAGAYLSRALLWSRAMWGRVLESPIAQHATWVDDEPVVLAFGGSVVDTVPVATADDHEALVRWFAEQQAVAEESIRAAATSPDLDEENEEVVLTRRNGSRARQSWRGGGTMRRR